MSETMSYAEQPTLPGVDPYKQGEQPTLPDMDQFELPLEGSAKELIKRSDWIIQNLMIIDQNLASGKLTDEGYEELIESKNKFESELEEIIALGIQMGYFSEGAPEDDYSMVAA